MRWQQDPNDIGGGARYVRTTFWVEYVLQETSIGWVLDAAGPGRDDNSGAPTNWFTSHTFHTEANARAAADTHLRELRSGRGPRPLRNIAEDLGDGIF